MTNRTIHCGAEEERGTILGRIKQLSQDYTITDLVVEDLLSTYAHHNLVSSVDALVFSITKEWETVRYQDSFDLQFLDRYGMWQKNKALMMQDYEENGINEPSSKLYGRVCWNAKITFQIGTRIQEIVTIFRDIKDDPHVLDMKLDGGLSSPSGLLEKIDWCKKNQNHVLGEPFVVDVECGWTTHLQRPNTTYKKYLNVVLCKIRETQRQIKEEYEEMKRKRRQSSRSPTRQGSSRSRMGNSRSPTRSCSSKSGLALQRTGTDGTHESGGSKGRRAPLMLRRTGSNDSGSSLEIALKRMNSLDSAGPNRRGCRSVGTVLKKHKSSSGLQQRDGVKPVLSPRVSRSSRQSLNPNNVADVAESLQQFLSLDLSSNNEVGAHDANPIKVDSKPTRRSSSGGNLMTQEDASSASSSPQCSPTSSPHGESKARKTRSPGSKKRLKDTTKSPRTVLSSVDGDDDAKNWRSAVDPSSGDTYYYHKITMETHWVKPAAMEEYEKRIGKITAVAKAG